MPRIPDNHLEDPRQPDDGHELELSVRQFIKENFDLIEEWYNHHKKVTEKLKQSDLWSYVMDEDLIYWYELEKQQCRKGTTETQKSETSESNCTTTEGGPKN